MITATEHEMHGLPDPQSDRQFYDGVPTKRLIAYLVDVVLSAIFALVLIVVLTLPTLGLALVFAGFVWAAADFFYRTLTLSGRSATLGMRFMGLELREPSGQRMEFGLAAAHTLLFYLCVAFIPLQILSVIFMASSPDGRGLPDKVLGTAMINRPL